MLDNDTLVVLLIVANIAGLVVSLLYKQQAGKYHALFVEMSGDLLKVATGTHRAFMVNGDTICIEPTSEIGFDVNAKKED